MPKSKRKLIPPTPEENAEINRQIAADPETADWSDPKNISVEQQIRELLYAEKFQPFQIVHKSGQVFDIVARDGAWVSPIGVYVVEDETREARIFDPKSLKIGPRRGRCSKGAKYAPMPQLHTPGPQPIYPAPLPPDFLFSSDWMRIPRASEYSGLPISSLYALLADPENGLVTFTLKYKNTKSRGARFIHRISLDNFMNRKARAAGAKLDLLVEKAGPAQKS